MTVYIDLVILLNFLTDLLLLLGTNRLAGYCNHRKRILAAAALGGIYSGLCMIPALFFLSNPFWYIVFLCLISWTAFGLQESAVRRGALFFLLSMALGGMAMAMQQARFEILLLEALGLWLLTRVSFGSQTVGARYIPITVHRETGPVTFTALLDTGNQLHDPVTGEPVTVVSPRQAAILTGLTARQLQEPMETMLHPPLKGLRLIPYCAVGRGSGMLLGLRFPSVTVGNHRGPALLAFAPEGFSGCGSYQALTGGGYLC